MEYYHSAGGRRAAGGGSPPLLACASPFSPVRLPCRGLAWSVVAGAANRLGRRAKSSATPTANHSAVPSCLRAAVACRLALPRRTGDSRQRESGGLGVWLQQHSHSRRRLPLTSGHHPAT